MTLRKPTDQPMTTPPMNQPSEPLSQGGDEKMSPLADKIRDSTTSGTKESNPRGAAPSEESMREWLKHDTPKHDIEPEKIVERLCQEYDALDSACAELRAEKESLRLECARLVRKDAEGAEEVARLRRENEAQAKRIRYLEGATNHAGGTPLSKALSDLATARAQVVSYRKCIGNCGAALRHAIAVMPANDPLLEKVIATEEASNQALKETSADYSDWLAVRREGYEKMRTALSAFFDPALNFPERWRPPTTEHQKAWNAWLDSAKAALASAQGKGA